jgi:predicted Zn finger-like uncharacterized protein
MLIVCPSCSSRYEIDAAKLGLEGRKVRCPSCSFEWHAHGEGTAPVSFVADEPDPFQPQAATEAFIEDEWKRAAELDENVSLVVAELEGKPETFDSDATALPQMLDSETLPVAMTESAEEAKSRPAARKPKPKPARVPFGLKFAGFARGLVSPAALACLGVAVMGVGVWKREAVVRAAPAMAIVFEKAGLPVNLRGLALVDITTGLTREAQGAFLVVEGDVSNITGQAAKLPLIEIVIHDEAGKPLYTWTTEPPRAVLNAGDKARFRARLAAPPQNGQSVVVRFAKGGTKLAAAAR